MPSTAAFATAPLEAPLWWRMPIEPGVKWRGMLPTEGGAVGMGPQVGLYPVPGAAGLLAAIVAHAAIANNMQSSEYQKAQQAADRVLDPYATELAAWSAANLWDVAVAAVPSSLQIRVWDGHTAPVAGSVVQTSPTFTLAPDESVVILDVAIQFVAPGAASLETLVRVVSSPLGEIDPRSHWSADEANQLKSTAAAMLAHAIDIAHRHTIHPANDLAPMRTHRYLFGADERTERAQQLAGNCARLELRNLRGLLMSVPIKVQSENECSIKTQF
ncbi:hypothetical protein [Limnobacter parvus]|uniref:Uncharacterized protein n=1 Tax=Limnobacter parvus TaxID=2939690 RepID=A0ABT1XL46_9BURK|nr:hypothetical protein [Limnobacter parvus]MCR2747914.1 hypothetical protein [Limnobacter parvus]